MQTTNIIMDLPIFTKCLRESVTELQTTDLGKTNAISTDLCRMICVALWFRTLKQKVSKATENRILQFWSIF